MAIQVLQPKFRIDETLEQIRECLEKGWTGMGFKTQVMEEEWAKYTGFEYNHFLASATAGLHLALEVFKREDNWGEEAEVITTPLTFVSSNHAILYAGLNPVFADVDENICLSPEAIEAQITDKTVAVMYVAIGGNAGRYDEVVELCKKHQIRLILDAAHAAGSKLRGMQLGQEADCVVFSYQAVKNLPTADSGMICFHEKKFDELVRRLTWLGINKDTFARTAAQGAYKWRYDVQELGYKAHGNSIMASMALVSLKYLEEDNAYRRQVASWYEEELANVSGISIVKHTNAEESSRHLFQIRLQGRDELLVFLNENDIYPGVHYVDNSEYQLYSEQAGKCPISAKASDELVTLPIHLNITREHVSLVCQKIKDFLNA
ncbi:DegT/DnrJ/EryC1/StrS family aminotransferase [Pseudoalteromonas sp. XMcav1-K]|uniref:DegT/DnrJ/EryC1/StrS family aminotransferase n=1 Tax=Pseudoalteromonas sp. XMcav1-K TaxID=3374372 RepID=UPI003756D5E2